MRCLGPPDVSSRRDVIFQCSFTTKTDDLLNSLTIRQPVAVLTKKSLQWPAVAPAVKRLSLAVSIGLIYKYYITNDFRKTV